MVEGGGEARTINLCQQCYNEKLVQQGKQSLKSKEWREVVERKAQSCRLWKIFGSEQFLHGMWGYFTRTIAWARNIPADATQAKQEGIRGQWQHESLFKDVLEKSQKKCGYRLQCPNDAPCVQCKAVGQLGNLQRGMQERRTAM